MIATTIVRFLTAQVRNLDKIRALTNMLVVTMEIAARVLVTGRILGTAVTIVVHPTVVGVLIASMCGTG